MDGAILEVLEFEAARLRKCRQAYRRILFSYAAVILAFVLFSMPASDLGNSLVSLPPASTSISRTEHAAVAELAPNSYAYDKSQLDAVVTSQVEDGGWPVSHVSPWERLTSRFPWPSVLFVIALSAAVLIGAVSMTRMQKKAAKRLAVLDDVRAVGPLTEALTIDDRFVRRVAEAALNRLLPQMNASDAHLLSDEHHAILNRSLSANRLDLGLAILAAYLQVGDHRDLTTVASLAAAEGAGRKDARIMLAAQLALPYVQLRADQHTSSRTLLRPVSTDSNAPNVLLRPNGSQPDADPDLLLRSLSTG